MEQLDKSYLIFFGMVTGFVSIYFGYKLFIKGIDGSSTMEGEFRTIKLNLKNAAPGIFFALFGTFMILLGIYKKEIYSEKINTDGYTYSKYVSKGSNSVESIDPNKEIIENTAFDLAVQYKKSNEVKTAKYLYYLLLISNTSNHKAHNNLANILLEEGNYEAAILHTQEAINSCKDDVYKSYYYDTLAKIYYKEGDIEEAIKAIVNAIELNPGDEEFKNFLNNLKSKN